METRPVEVVPFGHVDDRHTETVRQALVDAYGLDVRVGERTALPEGAHDTERGQYRADELLEPLPDDGPLRLGLTDRDITYRRRNYVFGIGYLGESRAVCSTCRLAGENGATTDERLGKQAVKQMGHLLGLENCDNRCAMRFAPTVRELDERPATLCGSCRTELESPDGEGGEPVGEREAMRADERPAERIDERPTERTGDESGERSGVQRGDGTPVAPSKADIEAIEASGEHDADRKGWGEQVVDEGVTTVRFVLTVGTFVLAFLVVGAGTFWLVEDVLGTPVTGNWEYGVLVVALLGAIYLTLKARDAGRSALSRVRD
jgi:archaemetzincin